MGTFPYASAMQVRVDSADAPHGFTVERRGASVPVKNVTVRMYEGRASLGYTTNYTHVEARWVEVTYTNENKKVVKRVCSRFTGAKSFERADKAYREVIRALASQWPGCSATFPTGLERQTA